MLVHVSGFDVRSKVRAAGERRLFCANDRQILAVFLHTACAGFKDPMDGGVLC